MYTPEQLQEKFDSLPQDIQQAITSETVSGNLEILGQKYSLRVDKIGDLIDEVGMVMLGFKKSSDFIGSLSKRLEIDRETAESLAVDIDNDVFKKIRESLRNVQFGSEHVDTPEEHEDPDYGHSPTRDSLLKEVERHGADDPAFSGSDYSADGFAADKQENVHATVAPAPIDQPTPYESHVIPEEEKNDPTKTFKDHLEKKVEAVRDVVSTDPYRESI